MLLLESAQLSNLTLEILDGRKLQKLNVVLRELNTSESKPGQVTNSQKQILSISILIWLKPSVATLFPSLKAEIFFFSLLIAVCTLYQHLLWTSLLHKVLGKFQRARREQTFHYFRRMKEVTPFSKPPQVSIGQLT